jgi:hypothetical protein
MDQKQPPANSAVRGAGGVRNPSATALAASSRPKAAIRRVRWVKTAFRMAIRSFESAYKRAGSPDGSLAGLGAGENL